ncbi:MAG: putative PEP-binding protein, partial [Geminicoccaceae bacterium]
MAERRYLGRSASPGLVIGPLVRAGKHVPGKGRDQGSPTEEEASLRAAMSKAGADLEALAAVASGDGADILAFQIAMLEDPALIEDALVMIAAGQDALLAWQTALQAEIDGYKAADDDYFQARASDLDDLKDRVSRVLTGTSAAIPDLVDGAILLDQDLTPSRFLGLDIEHLGGLALLGGSSNSHVAMLARARGVAMIVGIGGADDQLTAENVADAVLDADSGTLVLAPTSATRRSYQAELAKRAEREQAASERHKPAQTADGEPIEVMINVDHPDAVDDETLSASDGVGLFRTEFLFLGRPDLPGEDEQYQAYVDLLDRLGGKPAVIRTLDIGGDKPIAGLSVADEANPFLGLRGIRL